MASARESGSADLLAKALEARREARAPGNVVHFVDAARERRARVGVADVARIRCTHRSNARLWLLRNAPPHFIRRMGKRIKIRRADLVKLMTDGRPPIDNRVATRLAELEENVRELTRRVDRLVRDLSRLVGR